MMYLIPPAAFALFTALMLLWPAFNKAVAKAVLRAPPGYTFSGYTWKLEQDGSLYGDLMRPVIDAIVFVVSLNGQFNHCREAYERDAREAGDA